MVGSKCNGGVAGIVVIESGKGSPRKWVAILRSNGADDVDHVRETGRECSGGDGQCLCDGNVIRKS